MSELMPPVEEQHTSSAIDHSRFDIHIHYSHHDSDKDLASLRPLVKSDQFQIYVPEVPGHTELHRFFVEALASGDHRVFQTMKDVMEPIGDRSWPFFKSIYNARKIILFPDFDANEADAFDRNKMTESLDLTGDFAHDLAGYRDTIALMADYFNARDGHVAERLPELLQQAVETHPELQTHDRIGVLMSVGDWHTGLGHRLARDGFGVERTFQGWPHSYDHHGQAIRDLMFLGEVEEDVLERGFVTQLFRRAFDCDDHYHRGVIDRTIASKLDHEEIVDIVESNIKDPARCSELLEERLKLDNLLRSPKVKIAPAMSVYRKFKRENAKKVSDI